MRRNQKIVITALWGAAVLGMLSLLASGMLNRKNNAGSDASAGGLEILFDAPSFSVTDQNNQTVSKDSLRGKVWIASLFFTSCQGICPMMTSRLEDMQQAVASSNVELVSFSVDPEHDTPDVMRVYADKARADSTRWHFVTGDKQQMYTLARGLKLGLEGAHDNAPITHSQKALLVDGAGHVRGQYDTQDDDEMKKLKADAKTLSAEFDQ